LREFRYTDLGAQDREIPYVDGKIEGDVRTWGRYARYRSDGVQDETVDGVHLAEYSAGQMNGWSTTYDADGRLIRSGYRQGDRAHGVIRNYDVEGQQVRGWPKYFVRDMEVSHDAYVRAAQIDPVLKISLDKDRPDEAPDLTRPQS
jgi:hypothetical protein